MERGANAKPTGQQAEVELRDQQWGIHLRDLRLVHTEDEGLNGTSETELKYFTQAQARCDTSVFCWFQPDTGMAC